MCDINFNPNGIRVKSAAPGSRVTSDKYSNQKIQALNKDKAKKNVLNTNDYFERSVTVDQNSICEGHHISIDEG